MKHRHLDLPDDHYSIATIHSVLERGSASDVIRLLHKLKADPFSELAETALEAARTSEVYGYPEMVLRCVQMWRDRHVRPIQHP
jgi:hypothetical protein